jgi:steroid delta-isomerase-like uncharacterized protein
LAILSVGCTENSTIPETQGRALIKIWESGKVEDLASVMSTDAVYIAAQQNHSYEGIEEAGRYVGHAKLFASDLKIEVISVTSSKSTAVLEWIMTGTQDRPIPGRVTVATNREFSVRGVTLIEVKDGLISKATDYLDVLGFVIQLGARVEFPGGVVLESGGAPAKTAPR